MTAKNKLNNKVQYWTGRAKETVGRITGNRRTRFEGQRDQMKANLKDVGEDVKDAVRRPGRRSQVRNRRPRGSQRW
jgi:uncharacterized protein YjbJ (UPF0337 family)